MSAVIDQDKVQTLLAEAHELLNPRPEDRKATRRRIKEKLADVAKAEAELVELREYRGKLEAELDEATALHQTEAQRIQERLSKATKPESKVSLREELSELNTMLQSQCDRINGKLDACDQEIADCEAVRYTRPSLETALMRTGQPALLLELRVAERTLSLANQRSKAAAKALAEFVREHDYQQEQAARQAAEADWMRGAEQKVTKTPPSGAEYEFLQLDATTAAAIASEAAADVERIKQAIRDE
ncbi:MAG: hypothetical protein CMJ58_22620 [Planctomycetaceae bacterium]|nr:hypothetical protein [Planctomycetaceae bacterium]